MSEESLCERGSQIGRFFLSLTSTLRRSRTCNARSKTKNACRRNTKKPFRCVSVAQCGATHFRCYVYFVFNESRSQLLESQKQELLVAQNALDEQTKLVAKYVCQRSNNTMVSTKKTNFCPCHFRLQQERSSMALQIDSVGITANELQT